MGKRRNPNIKVIKKGDFLYKSGDPIKAIYVVQQGLFSVHIADLDSPKEIYKATPPHTLGEECMIGAKTYAYSVIALNDSAVLEVMTQEFNQLYKDVSPLTKTVGSALINKTNFTIHELKNNMDMIGDVPCPLPGLTKMFTAIYLTASYKGEEKQKGILRVSWPMYRKYCQRIFYESPVKIEQAMYLLKNLGFISMEFIKSETDPDAPDELGFLNFKRLDELGNFANFLRANLPKEDPSLIMSNTEAQGTIFMDILGEISYWNKYGLPRGMPSPDDNKSKYSTPKKAA